MTQQEEFGYKGYCEIREISEKKRPLDTNLSARIILTICIKNQKPQHAFKWKILLYFCIQ